MKEVKEVVDTVSVALANGQPEEAGNVVMQEVNHALLSMGVDEAMADKIDNFIILLFIIGIALLLATLNKFGVDQLILKVALFIYALIPVFPLYSILVGGDAFFSLMFLYFMIEVIWIFGTKGKIFYNKKFNGIMIITAFLLMAAKNQGL